VSEPSPAADSGKDLRLFPRRRARCSATVRPANKPMAPNVRVTLVNISHDGALFITCKLLEVGQGVVLELQSPAGNSKPRALEAVVRWVTADEKPGHFRIGCAWLQRMNFYDLQHFC
jgi:hypothetical protein